MAKKTKPNPYTTQAQADAVVRFGPEYSALTALLRDAEDRRDTMLTQAKTTRQSTVAAVTAALPQVTQAYQGAQQAVTPAFAGGGGVEASALQARLGESAAQARTQLQARRVGAVEGEGAARSAALRDYASDKSKIGQRALDLGNEQGAFITGEMGDLSSADAKATAQANELDARLGQSERNSVRSSGIDPDTGQPIPGGRLDPKTKAAGKKWASNTAQSAASDEIQRLIKEASDNKTAGESRSDTAQWLLSGAKDTSKPVYQSVPIYDKVDKKKVVGHKQVRVLNPDGTPKTVTVPGFNAAKSQLLASAALDMAYDGHLSRRNEKLLHDRGIQLAPLGLVTYQEWLKKNRQQVAQRQIITRPANAPDSNGQYRPT